jgi:hypothetical protein
MADPQNIFIVHGHDEAMKEEVANFVREIGHNPIILHERPNLGRTVIEKFEQEAADAGFAIVLLSPDDVGASVGNRHELNPRARQNVILELGYFVAKFGRHRVCPLYKGDVEIPSDILGVLYIQFDAEGAWKLQLIREMEAASMRVKPAPTISPQAIEADRAFQLPLLPNLQMRKAEVEEKLRKQIEVGRGIAGRRIRTAAGLNPAKLEQERWNAYNIELLARCFDGTDLATQYKKVTTTPNATYHYASRGKNIMRSEIEQGIRLLTTVLQRLELLPDVKD